jgi:NADPH:quinone reductase-like Zn-dependent oxidoreductase
VPIQPVDAKILKLALLKLQYPTVLGSTAAGTVEALGAGVTKFKIGDRIAGGTNIYPTGGVSKYGCQQRFVLAEARETIDVSVIGQIVDRAVC